MVGGSQRSHDQEGGFQKMKFYLLHSRCAERFDSPNLGNSNAQFVVIGD